MTSEGEEQIGDVLWRLIDWHRGGRRGAGKVGFTIRSLQSGALLNKYPFIDSSYIENSRATLRDSVIAAVVDDQWEEGEEEEENRPRSPPGPPPRKRGFDCTCRGDCFSAA